MKMVQTEDHIRKGPWTEQEDLQLVCFVGLFGDRRWDFIAKVSGLNRTGKSCRLRWVNYLHPGLKRGRMTPQEERLVLELHSRWGNRWSRIARKIPGRTDNEIKNYWRTHMRKKAQEMRKRGIRNRFPGNEGSCNTTDIDVNGERDISEEEDYSMDRIWDEIASPEDEVNSGQFFDERSNSTNNNKEVGCSFPCPPMASPLWELGSESLWKIDDEDEMKMLVHMGGTGDHFNSTMNTVDNHKLCFH
ncbi:transcription factor MYB59-like isoform X2 [Papaver somniferum]|uniref:transcription factor MYB59-like isoform X2 n=1 Tax=Papaver somniferum TaxID=3469 RepID=UPI000E703FA8|nr:transcription factor MYB59-like isoform X2 [Papaver somniferum]